MSAAPDFPEPFRGWRVWRVADTRRGLRLWSVLYDEEWIPGATFRAACRAATVNGHDAPARDCGCGVYGARSITTAARYLQGRNDPVVVDRVIGIVALWGSVLEAERGWRGSLAYPVRLWVPESPFAPEIAEQIETYGKPVEIAPARSAANVAAALAFAA